MGFLNDLADGFTQQANPFTTIGKAFTDLGSWPLDDAGNAAPTTTLAWLLGWIILIPLLPAIIVVGAIAFAVMAAVNALSK